MPGPQKDPLEWNQLETVLAAASSMLNHTPYLDDANELLLAPCDFITPWRGSAPSVQELPPTRLKSLAEARRFLMVKQEKMRQIRREELRLEIDRFKQGNLKLGHNKKISDISLGGCCAFGPADARLPGAGSGH